MAAPRSCRRSGVWRAQGIADRVHFVRGGKLAQLLNEARTAVTVNSTAGQQALWRGLAAAGLRAAVYAKPEFVSSQPLADFFAAPARPDTRAYRDYRHFLLETSQVVGGFYSSQGRRALLRQVVDLMLSPEDPYQALTLRAKRHRGNSCGSCADRRLSRWSWLGRFARVSR
jgi:capsular polysaccharide export protein